jgi:hypothetical protein
MFWLDWARSGQDSLTGYSAQLNESSRLIKSRKIIDQLNDYQFLNQDSAVVKLDSQFAA